MHSFPSICRSPFRKLDVPADHANAGVRWARRATAGVVAVSMSSLAALIGQAGPASASLPSGAGMVLNAPIVDVASTPDGSGYWEGASDGGVFALGGAGFYGSTGSLHLNSPIVGMKATPDGHGYWEVASDGGVFAFGDAEFYGSTGALHLNQPVVGIDSTPSGDGYWLVGSDGGVFAFGDARFYGSATGMSPTSPVVGVAATPDGRGYWEAALNGDVFAFGDARYGGNAPSGELVVGITASGFGYRLATTTGGIYTFDGIPFYGSTGGQRLNKPVIGMSATNGGYLTVASDGGIFTFGSAGFYGSLGEARFTALRPRPAARPVTASPTISAPRGAGSTSARKAGAGMSREASTAAASASAMPAGISSTPSVIRLMPPPPPPSSRFGSRWPSPPATGAIPMPLPTRVVAPGGTDWPTAATGSGRNSDGIQTPATVAGVR